MRCKFCGSTSIHEAEENKDFSYGKAAAGTVVFGPVGAVAGLSGKKIKGYRCAQCGSFMERPMDNTTESLVNDAIYKARSGDRYSMYEYYKQQYPNIESVTLNNTGSNGKTIDVHRNNGENIMSAQAADSEKAELKREYTYGYWQPDSPIYVQKVLINTKNGEDLLSLKMINQANKTIRSLYLQVTVVDDAGDQIVTKKCVYQGVNTKVGEKSPEDRAFGLGTDLAYRVDLFLEKAVFDDDSVWRGNDDATLIKIEMPDEIDEKTFPRYKYLVKAYEELTGKTILKWLRFHKDKLLALPRYIPVKENDYWICTCGMPVQTGKKCPVCNCEYDELQRIMSQETLIEAQRKEVKERAANRAQETSARYNEILRTDELREQEIKEDTYKKSLNYKNEGTIDSITKAIAGFGGLIDYKDSKDQVEACQKLLKEKKEEEERRAEIQRKEVEEKSKRNTKTAMIVAAIIAICLAGFFVATNVIIPNSKYNAAVKLMENEDYDAAIEAFKEMGDYKNSAEMVEECTLRKKYKKAEEDYNEGKYLQAYGEYVSLGDYRDSAQKAQDAYKAHYDPIYTEAEQKASQGVYEEAYTMFKSIKSYSDSEEKSIECAKKIAEGNLQNGDILSAIDWYRKIEDYEDVHKVQYDYVKSNLDRDNEQTYEFLLELCEAKYSDSQELYDSLFGYKLTGVINTDVHDTETDMESIVIKSSKNIYFHFLIEGGIPNKESVNLSFKLYHQSNKKGSMDEWSFDSDYSRTVPIGTWQVLQVYNTITTYKAYAIEVFDSSTDELIGRLEVSLEN